MLRRVEEVAHVDTRRIWGGTFHHVAHRVLREHAGLLGYEKGYSILDREDGRDVMAASIADCGLAVGARRFPRADVLIDLVSMAVNTQTPLADVLLDRRPQFAPLVDDVLRVARRYAERKHGMNAMDFDDLLLNWKVLLVEHEGVRRLLAERFRHVLVDEYQDTNRLQGDVVRPDRLAPPQPLRGRRRRPEHLLVPRRPLRQHPRVREALSGRAPFPPHGELPLHPRDPPPGQRLHREQLQAVPEGAAQRASVRVPPGPRALPGRRAAGGLRGPAGAGAPGRGHPAAGDRRPLPRAPPLHGDPVRAGPARDPVRGAQRRPLLRGSPHQGRAGPPRGSRTTPGTSWRSSGC